MLTRTQIARSFAWTIVGTFVACLALCAVVVLVGCGKSDSPAATATSRPLFTALAHTVGTSMLPTFGTNEVVALELCQFSDLASGDTVIYWHDGTRQYIHHRLSHRDYTDGRWVTRGDNNPGQDMGRFTSDEFVGRTRKLP